MILHPYPPSILIKFPMFVVNDVSTILLYFLIAFLHLTLTTGKDYKINDDEAFYDFIE